MNRPSVDPAFTFGVSLIISLVLWYPTLRQTMSGNIEITESGIRYFLALASFTLWPATLFLIPALGVGLAFSKVIPGINHQGTIQLGTPALEWILQRLIFPGVPAADIYLHPVARAAWVGMLATALNLLPVGQLDGGHVVYALLGRSHKWITRTFLFALLPMGLKWSGWWFWAIVRSGASRAASRSAEIARRELRNAKGTISFSERAA